MFLYFFRFCQQNKRVSFQFVISMLFLFLMLCLYAEEEPKIKNKVSTIVIDPGHGGRDPGAMGKNYKEKDIVLSVALKLGNYIISNFEDVRVIYTRSDDTFVSLDERAEIANKNKADLFISIHANASPKSFSYGTETFVMGEASNTSNFEVAKLENSVISFEENYEAKYEGFDPSSIESYIIFSLLQHTHLDQSLKIAGNIQDQFREKAKRFDRGVKQAGFLVLWKTTMPGVLVELGFISNPEEEKYLATDLGQDYLASALFRAFRDYKKNIESGSNFEASLTQKNNSQSSTLFNDDSNIYFKIQVISSQNRISLQDEIFKGCDFPEEFVSGTLYKYGIGKYEDYEEAAAQNVLWQMRFNGAFIIAIKGGVIIPVNQAITELKNKTIK